MNYRTVSENLTSRLWPPLTADRQEKAPSRVGLCRDPVLMRCRSTVPCCTVLYLDAGVTRLRLGLDADVSTAVVLPVPVRVVARVAALVGDDGGDGLGRIGLDEEPVERGRGALGDGGGLVGGVGFVRVSAVDHPALRDVDTGSAAHTSAARLRNQIPDQKHRRLGTSFPSSAAACTQAAVCSGHRLRALLRTPPSEHMKGGKREGNVRDRR